MTISKIAAEVIELDGRATKGPWSTTPHTLAGSVWVSARGSPLAEPMSPRDWFKPGKIARALFKMRGGIYYGSVSPGSIDDPRWKIQEGNAKLIAHYRSSAPRLAKALNLILPMLNHLRSPHDSHACERPDGPCYTCGKLAEFDAALAALDAGEGGG